MSNNRLTWAGIDERDALHQERRELAELRKEIEAARTSVPTRAEAQELEKRAGERLERMENWEQIEQQRRAAEPSRRWSTAQASACATGQPRRGRLRRERAEAELAVCVSPAIHPVEGFGSRKPRARPPFAVLGDEFDPGRP